MTRAPPTQHHALTDRQIAFARVRARESLHGMLSPFERRRLNALLRELTAVDKRIVNWMYAPEAPTDDERHELRGQSNALQDQVRALLAPYLPPGTPEEEPEKSLDAQRTRHEWDGLCG